MITPSVTLWANKMGIKPSPSNQKASANVNGGRDLANQLKERFQLE